MQWIVKQFGIAIGLVIVVIFVLAVNWLVDFLILSRVGLADVPLLGAVITVVLVGGLGWLFGTYFPNDKDKDQK